MVFICLIIFACITFAAEAIIPNHNRCRVNFDSKSFANIVVSFGSGYDQIEPEFKSRVYQTRDEKITTLKSLLELHSFQTQQDVISFLNHHTISFESYWISNVIVIENATKNIAKSLLEKHPEIVEIREEQIYNLHEGDEIPQINQTLVDACNGSNSATWGLQMIRAKEAWNISKGSGVTVGIIDTGVRYTHEALTDRLRHDYSWFDPANRKELPYDIDDEHGHGTHIIGTIVGSSDQEIGVAPEANFISCIGCAPFGCPERWTLACAQWMLCPTTWNNLKPNCSKAPRVINNSWGTGPGQKRNYFLDAVRAWIAADILPIFSIGNEGPDCNSTTSPGDYRDVVGVGGIHKNGKLFLLSSVGKGPDRGTKPDIVAPATVICSASAAGDDRYHWAAGTSMAAAHVTGVAALMFSVKPNLSAGAARSILQREVNTKGLGRKWITNCGDDQNFPNNYFGHGLIDALKAVKATKGNV